MESLILANASAQSSPSGQASSSSSSSASDELTLRERRLQEMERKKKDGAIPDNAGTSAIADLVGNTTFGVSSTSSSFPLTSLSLFNLPSASSTGHYDPTLQALFAQKYTAEQFKAWSLSKLETITASMGSFLQHIRENQLLSPSHPDFEATSTLLTMMVYLNQNVDWAACKTFLLEIFRRKDVPRNGKPGPTFAELVGPPPANGDYQLAILRNATFSELTAWKSLPMTLGTSVKTSVQPSVQQRSSESGATETPRAKRWSATKTTEYPIRCDHHNKFYSTKSGHSTDNCQAFKLKQPINRLQ
jgi:hypothetical protein